MPYNSTLRRLRLELQNRNNGLCLFLLTNENLYSFRSALTQEQQLEIISPIDNYLNDKDFTQYDSLDIRANTIYYITENMDEFHSYEHILEINNQIVNDIVQTATIRAIESEKIKLVIFKKGDFLFLYRYDTGKLFKQGWKAIFNNEEAIVEKEEDDILILSKMVPDIVFDITENCSFLINPKQSEYILNINNLFIRTIDNMKQYIQEYNIIREDTIDNFIEEVYSKNNYMRKVHNIQTSQSYQYFYDNIDKIPDVLNLYNLNVNFDKDNNNIIFDEETSVGDVLHLLADDYIKRYISERDDVIK